MTLATPFFEKILTVMSRLSLETCTSNLTSLALTILELLVFNSKIFRGHVTLATSFSKNV